MSSKLKEKESSSCRKSKKRSMLLVLKVQEVNVTTIFVILPKV
jgi:hypothetical protein